MSAALASAFDVPLAVRVEIAHSAGAPLVLAGSALEELHFTLVAARDVERAFSERSVAVADAYSRAERQVSLAQRWSRVALTAAALALASQLGVLLGVLLS